MSDGTTPKGHLFSRLYIGKGDPETDSPRFRRRLAAMIGAYDIGYSDFAALIKRNLGVEIRYGGIHRFSDWFESCELRDLLDSITLVARMLRPNHARKANSWIQEISLALREENLAFVVDQDGGIHPYVDATFQENRIAAVRGLSFPRYRAALAAYERAFAALNGVNPDYKTAIRDVFESVEVVFKLMFDNSAARLGERELRIHLKPKIDALYSTDKVALSSTNKLLNSLCEWCNSCHFYRHGHGTEEQIQPPIDVAVALIDAASGHLRWLISMDTDVD